MVSMKGSSFYNSSIFFIFTNKLTIPGGPLLSSTVPVAREQSSYPPEPLRRGWPAAPRDGGQPVPCRRVPARTSRGVHRRCQALGVRCCGRVFVRGRSHALG